MTDPTPRTIYFLWLQGLDAAPSVVRACYESWVRRNPTWDVVMLDSSNLLEYIELPSWAEKLTGTQISDIVRLRLLERSGGVWADATAYCNWDLDSWLPVEQPFFAFAWPARGYYFSSWFLYAAPGNQLVAEARQSLEDYWSAARLDQPGPVRDLIAKVLVRALCLHPRLTTLWFSRAVRDGLRVYPYFAVHYAFAQAIHSSPDSRAVWENIPKVSADGPHQLQVYGLDRQADQNVMLEIDGPTTPMYKLTWKIESGAPIEGSTLAVLLDSHER